MEAAYAMNHPHAAHSLVDYALHLPSIKHEDLPLLNPTFHPLIPLRLFLAAMSHESYRVLSDDSFFFKGSARKLLAKFSLPPPQTALRFLFHVCSHVNWLQIRAGKAELALETLYHVNFYQATLVYFCQFLMSRAFVLFPVFKKACPQTWFLTSAVDELLTLARQEDPPSASHLHLRPHHAFPDPLTTQDLIYLGLLTAKELGGIRYVQINPWYHEWIFDHIPSLKRKRHSDFGQRFIVQPNYDILIPPDIAWPSFLQLIVLTKAERCDLVCALKLSKSSILSARRIGIEAAEILDFFAHHAWSVPSNVQKSLEDWGSAPPPKSRFSIAHDERDTLHIDQLRKQANHLLSLSLAEIVHDKRKPGVPFPLAPIAPSKDSAVRQVVRLPEELKPPLYRENLIRLEECIREKRPCAIVHQAREGRRKRRHILPLRIHRDGISVFVEAELPELEITRSFKLTQILQVD